MARKKQQPAEVPSVQPEGIHDGETQPMDVDVDPEGRRPTKKVPRLRDSDILRDWEARHAAA